MDKESLLQKIRKLLALSKSSNEHEAKLAMQKVNELMTAHQIEMSEVLLKEAKINNIGFGTNHKVSETYRSFVKQLAGAAGLIFDCGVVGTGEQSGYAFVGLKDDITASEILFEYLFDSWLSIVAHDTKGWKKDYYPRVVPRQYEVKQYKIGHGQGFTQAVFKRAFDLVQERKTKVAATGTSLVVLKDQLVKEFITENTTKGRGSYKFQASGYFDGKERGQKIPLSGAIGEDKLRLED